VPKTFIDSAVFPVFFDPTIWSTGWESGVYNDGFDGEYKNGDGTIGVTTVNPISGTYSLNATGNACNYNLLAKTLTATDHLYSYEALKLSTLPTATNVKVRALTQFTGGSNFVSATGLFRNSTNAYLMAEYLSGSSVVVTGIEVFSASSLYNLETESY
jgi:hypothetical protein